MKATTRQMRPDEMHRTPVQKGVDAMLGHIDRARAALDTISPGWSAGPGGMLCSPHPAGGIIDKTIKSGEWFVVFNDGRQTLDGFDTRADAIEAFAIASRA